MVRHCKQIIGEVTARLYDYVNQQDILQMNGESLGALLMRVKDPLTGKPMSKERLVGEFAKLFLASFETTAHSLGWIFMELACHPEIQLKIQAELADKGLLCNEANPNPREIEWSDLGNLSYMNMAIKEAMRMHPSASATTVRITETATKVGPYAIPSNTMIRIYSYSV